MLSATMMADSTLRMGLSPLLPKEAYDVFGYLDSHRDETHGKERCTVLRNGDIKNQSHEETHEEKGVE